MKPFETLTVCGCEYHFKLTAANAANLEEQLGTDLLNGMDKLGEVKTLAKFYYAAAKPLNDNINTIDDVYQLFDDYITDGGTYETLQKLVVDIMFTSGILAKEAYDMTKKVEGKQKQALAEALEKLLN